MQTQIMEMRKLAEKARQQAYAPYSQFLVGVCLLADNSEYYVGCNVENASYGLTDCAEVGAISAMIVGGGKYIQQVVIVAGEEFCPPCGACRQRLYEFATAETKIYLINKKGEQQCKTLLELLPSPFNKRILR